MCIRDRRIRRALGPPVRRRPRLFAIHDVARNRQDRKRVDGVAVRRRLFQLFGHHVQNLCSDAVRPVVVVAIHGEFAHGIEFRDVSFLVAQRMHRCVFDGAQRVRDDRQACHAKRHEPYHVTVMQGLSLIHI